MKEFFILTLNQFVILAFYDEKLGQVSYWSLEKKNSVLLKKIFEVDYKYLKLFLYYIFNLFMNCYKYKK